MYTSYCIKSMACLPYCLPDPNGGEGLANPLALKGGVGTFPPFRHDMNQHDSKYHRETSKSGLPTWTLITKNTQVNTPARTFHLNPCLDRNLEAGLRAQIPTIPTRTKVHLPTVRFSSISRYKCGGGRRKPRPGFAVWFCSGLVL